MSTTDWLMLTALVPMLLIGGWVQTYRLWRHRVDISGGITWATGDASAVGAQAFALPGILGLTLTWLGVALDLPADGEMDAASIDSLATWLMGIGFLLLMFGFWMWLFAWPRFMVPPHLRGQSGWITASWREWRAGRQQRKRVRSPGRRRAGDRSAR